MMKELGDAINDSLSDSEQIAEVISRIKAGGYDVFVVLEATIGFNEREEGDNEAGLVTTQRSSGAVRSRVWALLGARLAILHQKMCSRAFTPRFTIDCTVAFTSHTFSSMTLSSSSGSPSKCIGSPK